MKYVFVDTSYWIAIINPKDQWHNAAKSAREKIGEMPLVTTDEVLTEFLNSFSERGDNFRTKSVEAVHEIMNDLNIKVIPQTRESFRNGIDLYNERSDKKYSLTDCISMNVIKNKDINNVLTSDHNFEQEGFIIHMKHT